MFIGSESEIRITNTICEALEEYSRYLVNSPEDRLILIKDRMTDEVFEITVTGNIDPGAFED